jgi:hypothetical protein
MAAPPRVFGETLAHEHIRGGAFVGPDGRPNNAAAAEVGRCTAVELSLFCRCYEGTYAVQ